jgi:predicted  nucleic acid-binding Zn-ribbon protein
MPRRAKLLYALQQTDLQLALKKRHYQQIEAQLGEGETLRKAKSALKHAQEEHSQWRATLLDRELEATGIAEKIKADEARLYGGQVRNPRELDDLQKDTEYLKRRQADVEEKQLEAMMRLEQATTRLAIAQEEFTVAEAAWKEQNAELSQEYESLKQDLAQLLARRKAVVKHIDAPDMAEYKALCRLRQGVAVVAVKGDMCVTCNVQVPQRDLEKAQQTDELFYCSGCERILYVPEES